MKRFWEYVIGAVAKGGVGFWVFNVVFSALAVGVALLLRWLIVLAMTR